MKFISSVLSVILFLGVDAYLSTIGKIEKKAYIQTAPKVTTFQHNKNKSKRTLLYVTNEHGENTESQQVQDLSNKKRGNIRSKVTEIAKRIVTKPIAAVAPQAIAEILTDATTGAVDLALEEVSRLGKIRQRISYSDILEKEAAMESDTAIALDTIALAKTTAADAFALAEAAIEETEQALKKSKIALAKCREDVAKAISIAEKSAYQANIASQKATVLAASAAITASGNDGQEMGEIETENDHDSSGVEVTGKSLESSRDELPIQDSSKYFDTSSLEYKDIDYQLSEMQPPFIGENQCLVPGEAVVRVEKATDNSRRIFAGIDIMASVDDVWRVSVFCSEAYGVHSTFLSFAFFYDSDPFLHPNWYKLNYKRF
jgi:hypothetical protein